LAESNGNLLLDLRLMLPVGCLLQKPEICTGWYGALNYLSRLQNDTTVAQMTDVW